MLAWVDILVAGCQRVLAVFVVFVFVGYFSVDLARQRCIWHNSVPSYCRPLVIVFFSFGDCVLLMFSSVSCVGKQTKLVLRMG